MIEAELETVQLSERTLMVLRRADGLEDLFIRGQKPVDFSVHFLKCSLKSM